MATQYSQPTIMFGPDASPESNTVTFFCNGNEMIKVAPDGFYVRGSKAPVSDNEALTVYQAFKEWLTWQNLTR